jgi:hypothetical protein
MPEQNKFLNRMRQKPSQPFPTADDVYDGRALATVPVPPAGITSTEGGILVGRVRMMPKGVAFPDDANEAEWRAFNDTLEEIKQNVNQSMQWIRADQIAFAATHLSATTEQLAILFNLKPKTIDVYARVGSNVGYSSRLETPTFSHAMEVAWLDEDAQLYWLKRAKDEALSVAQLRALIKGEKLRRRSGRKKRTQTPMQKMGSALRRKATKDEQERIEVIQWLRDMLNEMTR